MTMASPHMLLFFFYISSLSLANLVSSQNAINVTRTAPQPDVTSTPATARGKYGGPCHNLAICNFAFSRCANGRCGCANDFFYDPLEEICRSRKDNYKDFCVINLLCGFPNSRCIRNRCECKDGFKYDPAAKKCIQEQGHGYLKSCLTLDCENGFECINLFCKCPNGKIWDGSSCRDPSHGERCTYSAECKAGAGLWCDGGRCKCPTGKFWNGHSCKRKAKSSYLGHCESDRDCESRLWCRYRSCVCPLSEHWNGHSCRDKSEDAAKVAVPIVIIIVVSVVCLVLRIWCIWRAANRSSPSDRGPFQYRSISTPQNSMTAPTQPINTTRLNTTPSQDLPPSYSNFQPLPGEIKTPQGAKSVETLPSTPPPAYSMCQNVP